MITKEEILRRTNAGLDVFRYYIPGNWKTGKNFLNPFYADRHASANVWFCKKSATYQFQDFGNEAYNGDCFVLVGRLFGWDCNRKEDFINILDKIAHDLNIQDYSCAASTTARDFTPRQTAGMNAEGTTVAGTGKQTAGSPEKEPGKENNPVSALPARDFTPQELDWWDAYGITPDVLERFQVQSLSGLRFAKSDCLSTEAEPTYLYTFGQEGKSKKVYRPNSRMRFLFLEKAEQAVFGLSQLPEKGENIILTGGEKDVMTLSAAGFHAICMNSETADVPEKIIGELSKRFRQIILMYDTDETGLRCSRKIQEKYAGRYTVVSVVLPLQGGKKEKDISDYARLLHDPQRLRTEVEKRIGDSVSAHYKELLARFHPCLIDYDHPPVEPEATIRINHEVVATPGDLICITGGSGTGKSNYAACLFSGALNTLQLEADTLGLQVRPDTGHQALLYFDTEQSEYQSFCNLSRLLLRVQLTSHPGYLTMVNLCKTDRRERLNLIETYLRVNNQQHKGIHLVVIDGLADLISSVNEEAEAIQLVERLHMLAQDYGTVIAGVVHTASLQDKVRGHLGSELTRKSSAVIGIEKDKNRERSFIKVLKLRAGNASQAGLAAFHWSRERGYHVLE